MNNTILENEGLFEYKGYSIYLLYPNSGKSIEDLLNYDVILINAVHPEFASFTIKRLRGFKNPKMYLKPIYFLNPSIDLGSYINTIIDGAIFNLSQLDAIIPTIQEIITLNSKVHQNTAISYEAELIVKMLSFNFSRNRKVIKPIPYMLSAINFCYPGLSSSFHYTEEKKVFEILEMAENEGLISSEYFDKTHYCSSCYNGSLSYRSVCPKCSSSHATSQDIIHHFPCGYVGQMSDFTNEIDDALSCPKCNKDLRHIGVDYDKPSVLHTCNHCGNRYQDFDVKAKCLNCEFDNDVEILIEKELNAYQLTNKGENAVLFGYVAMQKEIEEIIGTVKFDLFTKMTKFEIERMKYSEHESFIALVQFKNSTELITKVGKSKQRELIKNIVLTVRNSVKPFDVITFRNLSTFLFTINEESEMQARIILNQVCELLVKLIRDNIADFEIDYTSDLLMLKTEENYKKQLDQFIAKHD